MNEKLHRVERWQKIYRPIEMKKFPLRIQKVLDRIELPIPEEIESTYFFGRPGSGKTVMACYYMLEEMKRSYLNYTPCTTLFIPVAELLEEIKQAFSTEDGASVVYSKYSEVKLLVLDDLGALSPTDWSYGSICLIIGRRYDQMLKTIITSNFAIDQLEDMFNDAKIPDRIQGMCEIKHLDKPSWRSTEFGKDKR